ncbi:sigma factor [Nocardia sp. NPDC049149]|uniref:sigma factor n=1 Tax=Nocardia sp. NPDC049149 TaxID=3364315 RepID=UPI00371F5624
MSKQSVSTLTRTPSSRLRADCYDNLEPLFAELAALEPTDHRRKALRDDLIERCLPLAEHLTRWFTAPAENVDDVRHCARAGAVLAVDGFEPDCGTPFLAFAVPTMMGEIRLRFRGATWSAWMSQRREHIRQTIDPVVDMLCRRLGHMPTVTEIADELGVDRVDVTQALVARNASRASSFGERGTDVDSCAPGSLGAAESDYRLVADLLSARPLSSALAERERQVLILRFAQFQRQIAAAELFGVSPTQVASALTRALNMLREQTVHD